jgi:hypothetical protein
MKKAILLAGLLVAASATLAAAQGMNLAINDCSIGGAVAAPANTCTSNSGVAMSMIGSAVAPAGMNQVVGIEAYIDGQTNQASLSPWWTLDGCRNGALTFNFDFTISPTNCADFWAGAASGGGGISPIHTAPNRFQIKLIAATPTENPIAPDLEYYLFRASISKAKTVGTGSCAGCTDAACLVMNRLVIAQPAGVGDVTITTPIVSNYVTYGGGAVGGGPNGGTGCPGATPSQNRTWGQVKSLYR